LKTRKNDFGNQNPFAGRPKLFSKIIFERFEIYFELKKARKIFFKTQKYFCDFKKYFCARVLKSRFSNPYYYPVLISKKCVFQKVRKKFAREKIFLKIIFIFAQKN